MKRRGYIFAVLLIAFATLLSGCGKKEAPLRIQEAFGVRLGILNRQKQKDPGRVLRWQKIPGSVEIFCTPHTKTIWRVDFVTTETTMENIHRATTDQWHCKINSSGEARLKQSTIKAVPEYRLGPAGIRLSVIDHNGQQLNAKEKQMPEVILAEKHRLAYETIIIIEEALEHFFTDTGHYPLLLSELVENPWQYPRWDGPYIDSVPLDPWHNPYHYHRNADGKGYDFFSGGKNGRDKIR